MDNHPRMINILNWIKKRFIWKFTEVYLMDDKEIGFYINGPSIMTFF